MSTTDWSILDVQGVMTTAAIQARKVAGEYPGVIEYDDLLQEAYISVATHPTQFRRYIEDEAWGLFAHALWCDLTDVARRYCRRANSELSYDRLLTILSEDDE